MLDVACCFLGISAPSIVGAGASIHWLRAWRRLRDEQDALGDPPNGARPRLLLAASGISAITTMAMVVAALLQPIAVLLLFAAHVGALAFALSLARLALPPPRRKGEEGPIWMLWLVTFGIGMCYAFADLTHLGG